MPEDYRKIIRSKPEEEPTVPVSEKKYRKITGIQYEEEVTETLERRSTMARDFYNQTWLQENESVSECLLESINITGAMLYDSTETGPLEERRARIMALLGVRALQGCAEDINRLGEVYRNSPAYQTDQLLVYSTMRLLPHPAGVIAFPEYQEAKKRITRGIAEGAEMSEEEKRKILEEARMSEEERRECLRDAERMTEGREKLMGLLCKGYEMKHGKKDSGMQKIVPRLQRLMILGHYIKALTNKNSEDKEEAARGKADIDVMEPIMKEVVAEEKEKKNNTEPPDLTFPIVWIASVVIDQYEKELKKEQEKSRAFRNITEKTRSIVKSALQWDEELKNLTLNPMKNYICDTLLKIEDQSIQRKKTRNESIWDELKKLWGDFLNPGKVTDRIRDKENYKKIYGYPSK